MQVYNNQTVIEDARQKNKLKTPGRICITGQMSETETRNYETVVYNCAHYTAEFLTLCK